MKVIQPFMRTEFNYDREAASLAAALTTPEPSLAVQDAAEEADINTIVRRFGLTGQLPHDIRAPQYGDFTGINDYRDAMDVVLEADRAFMALPADVRARFGNDPAELVDFVSNEANRDEARKLGLLVPEKAKPDPVEVRVIPDAAVSPAPGPGPK